MRILGAQATRKASIATEDFDVASELLEAVEPLYRLRDEVELGRRSLAAQYASALERRLTQVQVGSDARPRVHEQSGTHVVVARLKKLAGTR